MTCVLLDIPNDDRRVFTAGDVLEADILAACYDRETIRDANLAWRLVSDGRTLAEGGGGIGDIAPGAARKIASATIEIPGVDRPVKATLVVRVDGIPANEWDFWLFPRRGVRDGRGIAVSPSLLTRATSAVGAAHAAPTAAIRFTIQVA